MKSSKFRLFYLAPLMLIALALVGCTKTREEPALPTPLSGSVSVATTSSVIVATPTQSLVPPTLVSGTDPTTVAIEATATTAGGADIAAPAATSTALPPATAVKPTPIGPPSTSVPSPINPPGIHVVQAPVPLRRQVQAQEARSTLCNPATRWPLLPEGLAQPQTL